jgi:WD40 repeat protein
MIRVLFFAANPSGTPRLDLAREFREVEEEVRLGKYRDAVELILVPGTRPVDLLRKLNDSQPQVVHFSLHGGPDEIFLESSCEAHRGTSESWNPMSGSDPGRDMERVNDEQDLESPTVHGGVQPVSTMAIIDVLRSCNEGNLRLVVLNACETRHRAMALTEVVDCVISMNQEISDTAAIKFAASFYGALAFGRSVQRAFEQGVARLKAEAFEEAGTPELLVRPGIDASRLVLVGIAREMASDPSLDAPFLVPFPRNPDFVGREDDLIRLHASLSGPGPVGIRPAGLTGMGGIGKTQLAVEYVHRYRGSYPDGIFWIDAAGSLAEGLARIAADPRLRWAEIHRSRDEQILDALRELDRRTNALLVLDNLPDPATLALSLLPGGAVEDLHCRILFTTRRHDLGRFAGVEVTVLREGPAMRLLLRHPTRQAALQPSHPDHEHARAVARMLGRLPLALELSGAYLGKFSREVSLSDYRAGLKSDGALATLDADAADLTEADLRRVHRQAVAATIGEQWNAVADESARLLLCIGSLFAESMAVPIPRLGLLGNLRDASRAGRLSPLRRSVRELEAACLVEILEGDRIRLHPLIREFATRQQLFRSGQDLRRQCLSWAAAGLEDYSTFQSLEVRRGVDGLQEDLLSILELCPSSSSDLESRIAKVLRLVQREAHNLRVTDDLTRPALIGQQVRNRAFQMGIKALQATAECRLDSLGCPHFRLIWTASRESPALVRTLADHGDWVGAVAYCPDSRHAISGCGDHVLRLWDLRTGQVIHTLVGHEGEVCSVVVSSDGLRALSASHDGTVRVWDLPRGRLIRTLGQSEGMVFCVAISPDDRHAISGSSDGVVRQWELLTGELLRSFRGHQDGVCSAAYLPDGKHVLSGSRDGTVRLWDVETGHPIRTFAGHEGMVFAVAVSPDGAYALSGSDDRSVRVWDLRAGRFLRTLVGHENSVNALAVSPDGRFAVTGSDDHSVRLWELHTGELVRSLAGHEQGVSSIAMARDGRHAVSGSDDRTVKLWDLTASQSLSISFGHRGAVSSVAINLVSKCALTGSRDATVNLWELDSGRLIHVLVGHGSEVNALAISADGHYALSGSLDRSLRFWDLHTGQHVVSFGGHMRGPLSELDEDRAPSGVSLDEALEPWQLRYGNSVYKVRRAMKLPIQVLRQWVLLSNPSHFNSVATTSNGRCAITGSQDAVLRLWDLRTGKAIRDFVGHTQAIHTVVVTPDDRQLLSGSSDQTLKLWSIETGEEIRTLDGHLGPLTSAAVSPDGKFAVSGSRDRTVRIWDLRAGICRATLPLQVAPVSMALASDGRTLVVGDRVGNIHCFSICWPVHPPG